MHFIVTVKIFYCCEFYFAAVVHTKSMKEPKEKSHAVASRNQTYVHSKSQKGGQGKLHGKPRSSRMSGLPLGSMDATTIGCGNRSGIIVYHHHKFAVYKTIEFNYNHY